VTWTHWAPRRRRRRRVRRRSRSHIIPTHDDDDDDDAMAGLCRTCHPWQRRCSARHCKDATTTTTTANTFAPTATGAKSNVDGGVVGIIGICWHGQMTDKWVIEASAVVAVVVASSQSSSSHPCNPAEHLRHRGRPVRRRSRPCIVLTHDNNDDDNDGRGGGCAASMAWSTTDHEGGAFIRARSNGIKEGIRDATALTTIGTTSMAPPRQRAAFIGHV